MKKKLPELPFRISRLGSAHTEEQVRQAVASASLEGLKPTHQSVELVRAVAAGKVTGEDALNSLRGESGESGDSIPIL